MRSVVIAVCLLAAAWPAGSQQDPMHRTSGLVNGRWWRWASDGMKIGFIYGCDDARVYYQDASRAGAPGEEWFKGAWTYGDGERLLNAFFEEPANAAIPVVDGLIVVAMKFNGETSDKLQERTELLRKLAASPSSVPLRAPEVRPAPAPGSR